MTLVALEIFGYWIGTGVVMWVIMYTALTFARLCEYITVHLFR